MKKIILGIIFFVATILCAQSQNVTVKSVSLLQNDLEARTQPRNDKNGEPCAIIKVGIVGVEDLQFPDAVGDVKYGASEYVVYVPNGLKNLKYHNANGKLSGEVKLDSDYGIEIEKQRTYRLLLDTEDHFRAAVFVVNPPSARLSVDNHDEPLDENGMTTLKLPIGKHQYKLEAKGYYSTTGDFELIEDELSRTITPSLNKRTQFVTITTTPANATLFIDDVPFSSTDNPGVFRVELSEGKHQLRLTAENFRDFEQSINITNSSDRSISLSMEHVKTEVVVHKEERSKTAFNVRDFIFSKIALDVYDKNKYNAFSGGFRIESGYEWHGGGIFALHPSFSLGFVSCLKDDIALYKELNPNMAVKKDSVDIDKFFAEVSLNAGIFIPFYYNKHMFSLLGGGYYRWIIQEADNATSSAADDLKIKSLSDYGLRVLATIWFHKFSLGAEARQSLNGKGLQFGGSIGFRFYI